MPIFNVGGTNYPFPNPKEKKWGTPLTNWASAVSTQINQALGQITVLNSPYTPVNVTSTGLASISLVLNDPFIYDANLALTVSPISQEKLTIQLTNLDPLLPCYGEIQTDGTLFIQFRRDSVAVYETQVGVDAIGTLTTPINYTFTEIVPANTYNYNVGLKFEGTAGVCDLSNIALKITGGRV